MKNFNIKTFLLTVCFILLIICDVFAERQDAEPQKKGRAYYETKGDVVWEVPTKEKVIALTFDDGPDQNDTPQILDLLQQYDAKATFFVIGERVEKWPEIALREVSEGHELANHTYGHSLFNRNTTAKKIRLELANAQDAIYSVTGQTPELFRPPGGYYNETIVNTARQAGFIVIMWSWHQNTQDWNTPGVRKIVNKVLNNVHNGDIVLFHDFVKGPTQTIDALKQILPELKHRGYKFVTISNLLACCRSKSVS